MENGYRQERYCGNQAVKKRPCGRFGLPSAMMFRVFRTAFGIGRLFRIGAVRRFGRFDGFAAALNLLCEDRNRVVVHPSGGGGFSAEADFPLTVTSLPGSMPSSAKR